MSNDTIAESSIDTIAASLFIKKIQGRGVDIPATIDDNWPLSIDKASRVSIDCHLTVPIDAHHQRACILFSLLNCVFMIYFPTNLILYNTGDNVI